MEDLGPPSSFLTAEAGLPVYSSDGKKAGAIEHVLIDSEIFEGLVIDRSVLPGGQRFVDASQVDRFHEGGVVLSIDAEAAERLPKPSEGRAALESSGEDVGGREWDEELEAKLRRAWERISGKA